MSARSTWLLALGLLLAAAAQALPSFEAVRRDHAVSDYQLLDRAGLPLQSLRLDMQRRVLPWQALDQMSPALLQALLLSEDRNFYAHSGVDWGAVAASAWGNLWNSRTRGASTLTMQLAGLLDEELARPPGGRSLGQKLGQALLARQLEARWTKAQILEAYLNKVPLRGELVGVPALARLVFGKHPSGLNAEEAALTAALLRAPNAGPGPLVQRACALLQQQQRACAGLAGQWSAALARRQSEAVDEALAPHAARQLLRADGPRRLRSSLDAGLQRLALAALRQQLAELGGRQVEDGAVLVLDNASGAILAWVGSSGGGSASEVDHVLARRQPGSTLKPFVYQLALERRLITAASLLEDAPTQLDTGHGLYLPQNYDRRYRGWVSARAALGSSLNMPAVQLGTMLGADALHERLNAWGLGIAETGGYYGASLALGSPDVSLLALTNAYRALANGGVYSPAHGLPPPARSPRGRRVAEAASVFVVADMLADNNARAPAFGLDSVLRTPGYAPVKTGTSKDMRDNWCIGFSARYTVGVWVGNSSGGPMHNVSGVAGAAPVWQTLMLALHQERPSRPPPAPAGLKALTIVYEIGSEPGRREWFLAGTEQQRLRAARQPGRGAAGAILSPPEGAVYALDPDMPPAHQRLRFEGGPGVWRLNGRRLGQGGALSWAPWPGRHRLELLDGRGQVLQQRWFEVRGASLRPATQLPPR